MLECGLAIGLVLIAIDPSLVYAAAGVVLVTAIVAFLRFNGQWFTHWFGRTVRFRLRSHERVATPPAQASLEEIAGEADDAVLGADDPRVNLLRLTISDLFVASSTDHDRQPVGLAWHDGTWTAVLLVEPTPALISAAGDAPSLPLSALEPCLEDRGVLLDSIKVIWHCYPGSNALPADSPALEAYMEVLGPLPAAARRTTWVTIRLDPRRCPAAIRERGGGVLGAHRALIGALSRVRNALDDRDVPTRPLAPEELLRSGISAAELTAATASGAQVTMHERWKGVTAAGIGHTSYAITDWPKGTITNTLNALTSVRALSATVALSISPAPDDGQVGLRGLIRVSARNPRELDSADQRLTNLSERLGFSLTPLHGLQVPGLAATLPIGGSA